MTYFERGSMSRMDALELAVNTLRSEFPRPDNWDTLVKYAKLICVYMKPNEFPSERLSAIPHESTLQPV